MTEYNERPDKCRPTNNVCNEPTDKPYRDADLLRELYVEQELTQREISERLNCSNGTISRWLDRHGIDTRDNWKAGVEAAKRANRVERVRQRTLKSGYEYWTSNEWRPGDDSRTTEIVYIHRLLAVAEYGFGAVADQDVHHKNGIPWDNRADNIALIDPSSHGQMHANERHHGERVMTDGGTDGANLSAFQKATLAAAAGIERNGDIPYGLAIKRDLETYYGEEVNHGTQYPNLDELVKQGLLEKSDVDKRTNRYEITEEGRRVLEADLNWQARRLGLQLTDSNDDHRLQEQPQEADD